MTDEFNPSILNDYQNDFLDRMDNVQAKAFAALSRDNKIEFIAMHTKQGFVSDDIVPNRPLLWKPKPKRIGSRAAIIRIRDASPYPIAWKCTPLAPAFVRNVEKEFIGDPNADADLNELASLFDVQRDLPTSPEHQKDITDLIANAALPTLAEVVIEMLQHGILKGYMRHVSGALLQVRPSALGRMDVFDALVTSREIEVPTEKPKDPDLLFARHGFGKANGGLDLQGRVWFYAAEVDAAIQDFFYPPEQREAVERSSAAPTTAISDISSDAVAADLKPTSAGGRPLEHVPYIFELCVTIFERMSGQKIVDGISLGKETQARLNKLSGKQIIPKSDKTSRKYEDLIYGLWDQREQEESRKG